MDNKEFVDAEEYTIKEPFVAFILPDGELLSVVSKVEFSEELDNLLEIYPAITTRIFETTMPIVKDPDENGEIIEIAYGEGFLELLKEDD